MNGAEWLVVTKLDVLDELAEIPICIGYEIDGKVTDEIPADVQGLEQIKPRYTTLKGWRESTEGITEFDKLPQAAQRVSALSGARERGEDRNGLDRAGPGPDDGAAGVCRRHLTRFTRKPEPRHGLCEPGEREAEFMVSFIVRLKFAPEERAEVAETLRLLAEASRQEPGCVNYIPHYLEGDPDTVLIYEQYKDRAPMRCIARASTSRSMPWRGSTK